MLTAAFLVMSYWPSTILYEPLFFQKSIEVFVPPPIIRTPDALSKVGLSAHAQLFHNPTRSNVLGLTGSDYCGPAYLCRILIHRGFIVGGYDDLQRVRDEDEY